tara:strand:+ start:203 stop:418 length:216 start_codon:yes stop_codon:yes gene_type:complete
LETEKLYGTQTQILQKSILNKIMNFLIELWTFLKIRKKLWLAPLILVMLILGGLIILAEGSAIAPLIYTIF